MLQSSGNPCPSNLKTGAIYSMAALRGGTAGSEEHKEREKELDQGR
jgi:hypothetical protein